MSTFSQVLAAASGKWSNIAATFAGGSLDAAILNGGKSHVDCPIHGSDPKKQKPFRVFRDFEDTGGAICSHCGTFANGIDTLAWLLNEDSVKVRNEIADYLGLDDKYSDNHNKVPATRKPAPVVQMKPVDSAEEKRKIEYTRQTSRDSWKEGENPSTSRIFRNYLESRSLAAPDLQIDTEQLDSVMQVHPGLDYWGVDGLGNMQKFGQYPCLLSLVHNYQGHIVALHRTYLAPDGRGKADVECPKKLMMPFGSMAGAYIPLGKPSSRIAVCEGIETGLAIQGATGITTVATVSAPFMKSFTPPPGVTKISICADHDASKAGALAAAELMKNLSEKHPDVSCRIDFPNAALGERKGVDFLDVLSTFGPDAIRYQLLGA